MSKLNIPIRNIFICVIAVALLWAFTPMAGANSIVVNGDFESQMSGWTQIEPVAESSDTYSGIVSAKVGTGGRVYQMVNLEPNTEYMFEVYVDGAGTAGVTNSSGINAVETVTDQGDWTLVSTTFTTGSNPAPVELFGAGGSSGDVRFDDFSLSPTGGAPAPTTSAPTAQPTTPSNGNCTPIPNNILDGSIWELEGENPHPLVNDCTLRFVPLEAKHVTPNGNGWRHEYKIKSDLRVAMTETYEEFGATIQVDMSDGGKTIVAQHHASDTGTIMKLYVADSSETGFDSGADTTPNNGIFNVYVRILNESGSEEKQWLGNIVSGDSFSFHVLNNYGYVEVSAFGKSFGINVEDDSASYLKFGHYLQSQYPNGSVDCGTHGDSDSFATCFADIGITEAVITMTDVTYVRSTTTNPAPTPTDVPTTQPTATSPSVPTAQPTTPSNGNCTPIPTQIVDGAVWDLEGEDPHPLVDECTLRFVPLEAQHTTPNGNGWRHEYKIKQDLRVAMSETYEEFGATIRVDMSDGGKTIVAQHHASDTGTIMKLYVADSDEGGFDSGANTTPGDGIFNVYVRILNESGNEEKQWLGNIVSGDTFSFHVLNDYGYVEVSAFDKSFGINVEDDSASYLKFGHYQQSQYPDGTDCGTHGDSDSFAQCFDDIGITESVVTMTDVTYIRATDGSTPAPTSPAPTTPSSTPTTPSSCTNTADVIRTVTESTYDVDNNAMGSNVVDGDLSTRWSGQGNGAWVQFKLDGSYSLGGISLAFHKGDTRTAAFDIQVASSGDSWSTVYSGTSNGSSVTLESFLFDNSSDNVEFVRVVGHGNSSNDWNSITEVELCVTPMSAEPTPTSPPNMPTSTPTAAPTSVPTAVPANYTVGADYVDAGNAQVWFDSPDNISWVDLHYTINGGSQMNVRMVEEGGRLTWDVSNLDDGDVIEYSFTYFTSVAQDSGSGSYTHNVIVVQPTATSPAPTAVPTSIPAPSVDTIYVSSSSGGSVDGVSFSDEDILAVDITTGSFTMIYDGSDVGMSGASGRDTGAFHLMDDGSILISTVGDTEVPDVGNVSDSDILRFVPSSLGATTAGTFEMYFDGSDVGLTTNSEDIDAIVLLDDGSLLLSTSGSASVPDISSKDEDLLRFVPSSLGADTDGTWSLYFDGSDVSLSDADEDVWGVSVDPSGALYVSTKSTFSVDGLMGEGSDVIGCGNASLGNATHCDFGILWDGSADGYDGELIDGLHIGSSSLVVNNSMSRAAERIMDEGTVEDFNNADLNDNGRVDWIVPETFITVPLAVGLEAAGIAQSLPILYTMIGLMVGASFLIILRRENE